MRNILRSLIAALALSLTVATIAPAAAREDKPSFEQRLEALAREGADKLRRALKEMRERIERYMPRTAPNGDIIIPRPRFDNPPGQPAENGPQEPIET